MEQFVTVTGFRRMMNLPESAVRELCKSGVIPCLRRGGCFYIPPETGYEALKEYILKAAGSNGSAE